MVELVSILFMIGQLIFIIAKTLNFAIRARQGR